MRYINEQGASIEVSQVDLSKGRLSITQLIRKDATPVDNIVKFAYCESDYEDVYVYILNKEVESTPSQLDLIEAQVVYTAMMTDTLLTK